MKLIGSAKALLLVGILVAAACGDAEPASPEEALQKRAEAAFEAANKRDLVGFYQFASPGFRETCEPEDFVEWTTRLMEFQREEFGLEEDDHIQFRVSRVIVEAEEGKVLGDAVTSNGRILYSQDETSPDEWVLVEGQWWRKYEDGCLIRE